MAMQWFYCNGSNSDPMVSALAESTGFSILPGAIGRDGRYRRQFSVGGQRPGINAYSRKRDAVVKFMKWYFQREQQSRYARV